MSDNITKALKDARAALVSAAGDQSAILREAGFEDFVYSNDEVGKACKSCWRSYTQCCKRLKAGKSTCCNQCKYTATHSQQSLDSVLASSPAVKAIADAVKAIDAQIREFSPVVRAEKALAEYNSTSISTRSRASLEAVARNLAEALADVLKEQKA